MKKLVFLFVLILAAFCFTSCGSKKFEDMTPAEQAEFLFIKSDEILSNATSYEVVVDATATIEVSGQSVGLDINSSSVIYGIGSDDLFHRQTVDTSVTVAGTTVTAQVVEGYEQGYMYQKYTEGKYDAIRHKSVISPEDYMLFLADSADDMLGVDAVDFGEFDVSVGENGRYTVKLSSCSEVGREEIFNDMIGTELLNDTKVVDLVVTAVITGSYYPVSMDMEFILEDGQSLLCSGHFYSINKVEAPAEDTKLNSYNEVPDLRILHYLETELKERKAQKNGNFKLDAFYEDSNLGSSIKAVYSTDEDGKLSFTLTMKDYNSSGNKVAEAEINYKNGYMNIISGKYENKQKLDEASATATLHNYLDPFSFDKYTIEKVVKKDAENGTEYYIYNETGIYVVTVKDGKIDTLVGRARSQGITTYVVYTWEFTAE